MNSLPFSPVTRALSGLPPVCTVSDELDLSSPSAIVAALRSSHRTRTIVNHEYVEHALALFRKYTDFCVFDLETTDKAESKHGPGVFHPKDSRTCRVMQLAARRYRWNHASGEVRLIGQMNVLVNDPDIKAGPGIREDDPLSGGSGCCMNQKAFETHGIRLADLRRRGLPPAQVWDQFLRLAKGAVLVGQNIIQFDIPVANRDLARHNIRAALNEQLAIDTLIIARHVWDKQGNRLRQLASFLRVQTDPALDHDALGDIDTTWKVWVAMQPYLRTYRAKFIVGTPDQYKRALGQVGTAWPVRAR